LLGSNPLRYRLPLFPERESYAIRCLYQRERTQCHGIKREEQKIEKQMSKLEQRLGGIRAAAQALDDPGIMLSVV
jgi:hypothetical protein